MCVCIASMRVYMYNERIIMCLCVCIHTSSNPSSAGNIKLTMGEGGVRRPVARAPLSSLREGPLGEGK